jgi:hypothetical protein
MDWINLACKRWGISWLLFIVSFSGKDLLCGLSLYYHM